MAKAVRFHKTGGPEVLVYEDVSVGDPGPDEARVKNTAIGLNFIDTYHRSGLYPLPLPSGVGLGGRGRGRGGRQERHLGQAGRSRRLRGRTARRLLRGAADSRATGW